MEYIALVLCLTLIIVVSLVGLFALLITKALTKSTPHYDGYIGGVPRDLPRPAYKEEADDIAPEVAETTVPLDQFHPDLRKEVKIKYIDDADGHGVTIDELTEEDRADLANFGGISQKGKN